MGMTNKFIEELFQKEACFLTPAGGEKKTFADDPFYPVIVSSRIRLARNLKGYYFPARADDPSLLQLRQICLQAVRAAAEEMGFSPWECQVELLALADREFLLERHLVSREFLNPRKGASLIADPGYGTFVMLNEEDHLRIQTLGGGMCLRELWKKINTLDDHISARTEYAYDPELGYLTSCPSNTGTGMRASAMLHLPALSISGQMNAVTNGIGKLNCTIRGFYGEGSKVMGNFYQISNQSTLGESEEMILNSLEKIIKKICEHEKKTRLYLLQHKRDFLLNYIGRSYALAKYSYAMKSEDVIHSLSGVLLGVNMGMFPKLAAKEVMQHILLTQKAHLLKMKNTALTPEEQDSFRAELIRSFLRQKSLLPANRGRRGKNSRS